MYLTKLKRALANYPNVIQQKEKSNCMKTELDIYTLYSDFLSKIDSMTRLELFESARIAEETSRHAHILDDGYLGSS